MTEKTVDPEITGEDRFLLAVSQPAPDVAPETRVQMLGKIALAYENDRSDEYAFDRALDAAFDAGRKSAALQARPDAALVEFCSVIERFVSETSFGNEPPEDNKDWINGFLSAQDALRERLKPWWPFGKPILLSALRTHDDTLEAALRFYADEGNWKRRGNLPVAWHDSLVSIDHGDNARQALQENTDVG